MADRDLLALMADILRRQDQHSELLGGLVVRADRTNENLLETNNILKDFMSLSIKQWEEQQKFNERLYTKVEGMEKHLEKISDLEDRVKRIENILFKAS